MTGCTKLPSTFAASGCADSAVGTTLPKNEPKPRNFCGKKDTTGLPQRGMDI
jgi:hypothetical protein